MSPQVDPGCRIGSANERRAAVKGKIDPTGCDEEAARACQSGDEILADDNIGAGGLPTTYAEWMTPVLAGAGPGPRAGLRDGTPVPRDTPTGRATADSAQWPVRSFATS